MSETQFRMPAEWELHAATWLAWPFLEEDFPGKVAEVERCYCEIISHLQRYEQVECVCASVAIRKRAEHMLRNADCDCTKVRFHVAEIDRTWLRDSAPTAVLGEDEQLYWMRWKFNAWAKYENYSQDAKLPNFISGASGIELRDAWRLDLSEQELLVLEGGAIDTDGSGTLLVTEECLLSDVQERNPGLGRSGYEKHFREYLGIETTIWLASGCLGDDTHGHVDDIARFVAPGVVVVALPKSSSPQYASLVENKERLEAFRGTQDQKLEVVSLPMPDDIFYQGEQLPASYANFYIANNTVLVPTFDDAQDKQALGIISELFPQREVRGIYSRDLVVGQGTLHCLSQQQPFSPTGN